MRSCARRSRRSSSGTRLLILGAGWTLALGALGLSSSLALASPNYPGIINDQRSTDCDTETRCLICHTSAAGGEGTAVRPFAVTLAGLGLTQGKAGRQLAMALQALPADVDSDADGITDVDELQVCMNPSGEELGPGPGFGCNARLAPARRDGELVARIVSGATLLALGLSIARRRAVGRR